MAYDPKLTHIIGGNTAGATANITSGSYVLAGGNNITLSQNGNSVTISGANAGGAQTAISGISGGTTQMTSGTAVFSNSNNVSFGVDGNTITASASYPAQTSFVFSNSNGVSFGTNGSTVTATVKTDYLTTQSGQAFSADASSTFQTLVFQDSNGISFSNNAGALRVTHGLQFTSNTSAITSNALHITSPRINVSAGTTSNNLSALTFSNANGITFGINASTITASHNGLTTAAQSNQVVNSLNGSTGQISLNVGSSLSASTNGSSITFGLASNITTALQSANANYLTSQSNQAFSASGGSSAFQTLNFANSNGVTFSNSNGSVIASHNGITTARASTDAIGLNTAQSNVTWTVNSSGLSLDARGYAGTGSTFNGANISGSMTVNSVGVQLSMSVAAPGAAAENNWVNLGGNTAGNTTASGSTIKWYGGNNITLHGTNGSEVSIIGGGGGGVTLSGYRGFDEAQWVVAAQSNASLIIEPKIIDNAFQYDRVVMPLHYSQATNSTLTVSNSVWWGFFTKNAGSLSLYTSGSGSFSINGSGTASSAANSGLRYVTMGDTETITAGNYWIGYVWRTTTAGANASLSNLVASQINSTFSGYLGSGSVTNNPYVPGRGVWTSTTAGMPASLAFSDIRGNSSAYQRPPIFMFTSGTW